MLKDAEPVNAFSSTDKASGDDAVLANKDALKLIALIS